MTASSFGQRFVVTSFGESHGPAIGAVIDGCPAGVPFDLDLLHAALRRRRPGQTDASGDVLVSARAEPDAPEILSGVYQGRTLGTPIAMLIRNVDARSGDYAQIGSAVDNDPTAAPRRGHADDLWRRKFGHSDPRGGGRASGRETATRVLAGAVAQMLLRTLHPSLHITAFASQIGPLSLSAADRDLLRDRAATLDGAHIDSFPARFPSPAQRDAVADLLRAAKRDGHSYGGTAELWLSNVPACLGQPIFHKLKADLAAAMLSIGATCGVEIGAGHAATHAEGSQFHAAPTSDKQAQGFDDESPYGGIRGGISTGERITLRVSFKPTASVLHVAKAGRHDPCIIPRALPVLEAMAALVIADHALWAHTDRAPST